MNEMAVVQLGLGIVGSLCVAGILGGVSHSYRIHGRVTAVEARFDAISDRLDRIERKLDRVIERWVMGDDET